MQMSKLFSQTLREAPSDAGSDQPSAADAQPAIFALSAPGFLAIFPRQAVVNKIEKSCATNKRHRRGRADHAVIHPATCGKRRDAGTRLARRWGRFQDRGGRDMALAMTHEEVVGDLVRKEIHSYKQLPQSSITIQTKWRDDPRPRAA